MRRISLALKRRHPARHAFSYNLHVDFKAAQEFVLSLGHGKMDFDLARLRRVLAALGVAEPPYPVVIVGGTNGKGSVIAITEAILQPHLRVGSFLKPHLFQINERIRVDGVDLPEPDFAVATAELKAYLERGEETVTYFEATLVLALLAFRRAEIELALIEVGLGGRFDAANVLPRVLTVITSISTEHEQHLGTSPSGIAFEKAGIMREGVPVVLSPAIAREPVDLHSVLRKLARLKGTPLHPIPLSARRLGGQVSPPEQRFELEPAGESILKTPWQMSLNLLGIYQKRNLEVALAVVDAFAASGHIPAIHIPEQLSVYYRGRFEVHTQGRGIVIFDAAHNPEGCAALANTLASYFAPENRFHLLFGCQEGKDVRGMLEPLTPWIEALAPIQVDVLHPMPRARIAEAAKSLGLTVVDEAAPLTEQVARAHALVEGGGHVLVCGSIYYLGTVMDAMGFGRTTATHGESSQQ